MTPRQTQLYFREWAAVRKAKPDADRHALHIEALGRDKSSKKFSNSDFDRVLKVFRAISQPDNLNAQLRQDLQSRHRLEYVLSRHIQCLGIYVEDVPGYVAQVIHDKFSHLSEGTDPRFARSRFGTIGVDDLSDEPRPVWDNEKQELVEKPSELQMLVMTLWARLNVLRERAGHSLAAMYGAAELSGAAPSPKRSRAARGRTPAPAPAVADLVNAGDVPDGEDPF